MKLPSENETRRPNEIGKASASGMTAQISAENPLQKNKAEYRIFFDGNPNPMWVFHQQSLRFLEVNEAAITHYGYSRAEFLNLTISDIRPPEDVAAHAEYHRKVISGELKSGLVTPSIWRHRKKDGTIIYVEIKWTAIELNGAKAQLVLANDVTEQRRNEFQNAVFTRLAQNLGGASSADEAAKIIVKAADELLGWDACSLDLYSAEHNTIRPILNLDLIYGKRSVVAPAYESYPPSPRIAEVIKNGGALILRNPSLPDLGLELRPFGNTGKLSASILFVPIRHVTKVIGVLSIQSYRRDAYSQKSLEILQALADQCGGTLARIEAQEALRISEARFHSVWENSVDGMRLTDENGIVVAINKAFCKLVEIDYEELVGKPFTVMYASTENHAEVLEKYIQRFQGRTVEKFIKRTMTFRSGKTVDLEGANSFVDLEGGRPLLLVLFRDVTEQRRLESQLRQSQKMDSIGQLAGGIAHDFNNLLTVIQGHASLLLATEKGDIADSLQQISMAAERSSNLTRQLLTFSRRQILQRHALDLKEVVDEMTKMLRRILGEDILLKVENSSDLPRIHADRGMMEQILLNLSINSRDAMPRGGELTIATRPVRIDETYTRGNSEAYLGEFVCLEVSDNGGGILPENLVHIFEPFFTTKEVGKGTGLGLATVYGIVKQHEGWIEVASEAGKGTRFKIFFPRSPEQRETPANASAQKSTRGTETILLVEDEMPLRQLVQFLLEREGYRVLEAESGVAALKVWGKQKHLIDLLFTDLVMPDGITGRELSERLQGEKPTLKIIFTSGYSADIVGKDFVLREGLNFLQKPYHPEKLTHAVRDCLDGK